MMMLFMLLILSENFSPATCKYELTKKRSFTAVRQLQQNNAPSRHPAGVVYVKVKFEYYRRDASGGGAAESLGPARSGLAVLGALKQ